MGWHSSLGASWEPKHVILVPWQSSRLVDLSMYGGNDNKRADRAQARSALSMASMMSYAGLVSNPCTSAQHSTSP